MIRRSSFTYANVMATIAVFIALGGTSYAVATLNGATIKARSIPGNRVKVNALTGVEVNERKLGIVPKAKAAISATTAATATTASTATSATRATAADSADLLAGSTMAQVIAAAKAAATPKCPTGTELVGGVCFETALRAASGYAVAVHVCSGLGRRLASQGEISLYTWSRNIAGNERTDQLYYDGDGASDVFRGTAMYFDGTGGSGTNHPTMTDAIAYRCVVPPSIT